MFSRAYFALRYFAARYFGVGSAAPIGILAGFDVSDPQTFYPTFSEQQQLYFTDTSLIDVCYDEDGYPPLYSGINTPIFFGAKTK